MNADVDKIGGMIDEVKNEILEHKKSLSLNKKTVPTVVIPADEPESSGSRVKPGMTN